MSLTMTKTDIGDKDWKCLLDNVVLFETYFVL